MTMSAKIAAKNPETELAFEMMSVHVPEAVAELFAGYDLPVCPSTNEVASTTIEREVAASIGFTATKMRGVLMLKASEASITRWLDAMGMAGGDLPDTLSEFSNMLLGRIKGRLLREGLPITLATPTATAGSGLRFSVPPGESVCRAFEGNDWSITVRMDATFEADFAIDPTAVEDAAEAGECILF